ncbi:hypothetical protein [Achromobacter xylosoxidans]|uniref:hypothetical protein n=1 Tax=Alcaligenes xylosoxydans xylosoxydans TaxID=85698 RepID=UPI0012F4A83D|nr:hypothetical protein [Achromobacter xylosoxidans]
MKFGAKDLTGRKFGRWAAIGPKSKRKWLCRCECGAEKAVDVYSLLDGRSTSCGCLRAEQVTQRNTTHGQAGTQTYRVWKRMIARCEVPSAAKFKNYGGRGIKVCERWHSYPAFLSDMGERPPGLSIDRIDVNGDYEPGNCRWATDQEQARNKRTTRLIAVDGADRCISEWSAISGVSPGMIGWRIAKGWPPKRAIFQPTKGRRSGGPSVSEG